MNYLAKMEYSIYVKLCVIYCVTFVSLTDCFVLFEHRTHGPMIDTNYGLIEGLSQKVSDKKVVHKFLGIPFAKAPVDDLRFAKPQKHEGWEGRTLKAIKFGNICMQPRLDEQYLLTKIPSLDRSEDCLFLNIYVPATLDLQRQGISSIDKRLSVMVFIHGGGFNFGSGAWKDGTTLANVGDVIVVTLNYRLGMLGFVCSGDDHIPGNNGYLDQNAALRWVHENIIYFGGEPNNVTIFGESAGAESVLAHVLSPMSKGLFRGAIVHSTSGARFASEKQRSTGFFYSAASYYGCEYNNTVDTITCLKTLDPAVFAFYNQDVIARVIDGEFITDSPDVLWRSGNYNHVNLMLGFTSDDGRTIYSQMSAPNADSISDYLIAAPISVVGLDIPYLYLYDHTSSTDPENEMLISLIRNKYEISDSKNQTENKKLVLQLMRDSIFASYSRWVAETTESQGDNVYMFYFSHRTNSLPKEDDDTILGAEHGEDTLYAMGDILSDDFNATQDQIRLTFDMMSAWSSFAKTTIPTVNDIVLPAFRENDKISWNWDTYSNISQAVSGHPISNLLENKMEFWNHVTVPIIRKYLDMRYKLYEWEMSDEEIQAAHTESSTLRENIRFKTNLFRMDQDTADGVVIFLMVVCILLLLICMSTLYYLFNRKKLSLYL